MQIWLLLCGTPYLKPLRGCTINRSYPPSVARRYECGERNNARKKCATLLGTKLPNRLVVQAELESISTRITALPFSSDKIYAPRAAAQKRKTPQRLTTLEYNDNNIVRSSGLDTTLKPKNYEYPDWHQPLLRAILKTCGHIFTLDGKQVTMLTGNLSTLGKRQNSTKTAPRTWTPGFAGSTAVSLGQRAPISNHWCSVPGTLPWYSTVESSFSDSWSEDTSS